MTTQPVSPDGDLFYEALVRSYVDDNPRFVARPWLAERLKATLADPGCRFVLLTCAVQKPRPEPSLATMLRRGPPGDFHDVHTHPLAVR